MAVNNPHAISFQSGDYIEILDDVLLRITGDVTIETWVYVESFSDKGTIIAKYSNNSAREYDFRVEDNGLLFFGDSSTTSTSLGIVNLQEWTHIAIVRSNSIAKFYINGILDSSKSHAGAATATSSNVQIGYRMSTTFAPFNGKIDELKVWNVAKTEEEINKSMTQQLEDFDGLVLYLKFDEGEGSTVLDSSENEFSGNIHGATWVEGEVDFIKNKVLISSSNGDIFSADINNDYYDTIPELTGDVPQLTSTPTHANYPVWKVFNKKKSYDTLLMEGSNTWIQYDYENNPRKIVKYKVVSGISNTLNFTIKDFRLEGSNDGVNFVILDEQFNKTWETGNKEQEFIFNNDQNYRFYRFYVMNSHGADYSEIDELIFYEKGESLIKKLPSQAEQDFIDHGINIPLELDFSQVFTKKEIINLDGTSSIEEGKFILREEVGDNPTILHYTNNAERTVSQVTVETNAFTLYDEIGDSMDILYYTDDDSITEAQIEFDANYSPLDEAVDGFDLVTWVSGDNESLSAEVNAIPSPQLLVPLEDIHVTKLDGIQVYTDDEYPIRLLFSGDSGQTWKGQYEEIIDPSDMTQVREGGIRIPDLESFTQNMYKAYFPNNTVKIAFYLENDAQIDRLTINDLAYLVSPKVSSVATKYELLEGERPTFYVSRDNGVTWKEIQPDALENLQDQPEGQILRIKAVLESGQELYGLSYAWI